MTNKKNLLILLVVIGVILVVLGAIAVWQYPRLLGTRDVVIARSMPNDTAVYLELNMLNLQNADGRFLTSAWEDIYDEAGISLSDSDPSTLLNGLDIPLNEIAGITVSEDVRPWIGLNIGLGILLTETNNAPGWLLIASVRDSEKADEFVNKLATNIANQGGLIIGGQSYQPEVRRTGNLLFIASDKEVLIQSSSAEEGLNLTDSDRYQQAMAELPQNHALTAYGEAVVLQNLLETAVPPDNEEIIGVIQGILPDYTTVGLSGTAIEQGIQVELVGLHDPLNEAQTAWLEAQTAEIGLDAYLPAETAVMLTGHRLDLIWQLAKGSLAGFGYAEADVEESMEIFTGLFGFNPDTDLLATLTDEYSLALVPIENNLLPVALITHPNSEKLAAQIEQLGTGLSLLGLSASQRDDIYTLSDLDGQTLVSYSQLENILLLSMEEEGITAVSQTSPSLTENKGYQTIWQNFPNDTLPVLFVNFNQIKPFLGADVAISLKPISRIALATQSDNTASRGTFVVLFENNTAE